MGRPRKIVDEDKIADLAYHGSSNREIADIIGIAEATVRERFRAMLKKKRAERRSDLRKAQWDEAHSGNAALLIWLGKNELDQSDKPDPPVTKVIVTYADKGIDDRLDEAPPGPEDHSPGGGPV